MAKRGPNTSLGGMHDILFQQLEKIANPDLKGADLEEEMMRTDSIAKIAEQLIENGNLAVKVAKMKADAAGDATGLEYLINRSERVVITDVSSVDE